MDYEGMRRLYLGDFSSIHQDIEGGVPGGGTRHIIVFVKDIGKAYDMKVKDLFMETEKVIEHKEIEIVEEPEFISGRKHEANLKRKETIAGKGLNKEYE